MNYKKLLFGIGLACCTFAASAETYMDDPNNVLYASPVTCQAGQQATLEVSMKNADATISGFQFDLYLPDGISVDNAIDKYGDMVISASMSDERFNPAKFTFSTSMPEPGNDQHLTVLCYSSSDGKVIGNDGVVATITLNVAEGLEAGDYNFYLKNTVVSSKTDTYMNTKDVVGTITVSEEEKPSYPEGYSLDIVPFKAEASKAYTLVLNMTCATEDITDIEFDVVMPSNVLSRTKSGRASKAPDFANDDRIYFEDHSIAMDANGHVTIQAICEDEYRMIAGTSGSLVNLYYTAATSITEGIYQLELKNIKMTQDDGTVLSVAPYTADIYVGNVKAPDTDGEVVYNGNYSTGKAMELLEASLPEDFTALNLTGVTALSEMPTLSNPNVLIKATADLGWGEDQPNVVIGKECNNLVITDGHSFGSPWAFTADNASYVRTLGSTNWGTLYLPFAVESSADVKYYILESATTTADGVMKFTEQNRVEANTPCVFYVGDGTFSLNDLNVNVPKSKDFFTDGTGSVEWTMSGTLSPVVKDVSKGDDLGKNLYYIRDNKFWKATGKLTINPFRAFFETTSSANASYRIVTDEEGIESIEADMNLESGRLYDLNGREVKNMQKGEIYLLNGMKVMFQ